jgi:hypothetical protein
MRLFLATIVGLAALVATSMQAAPVPSKARSAGRLHETPAENVRKSQLYDHLLSTNPRFRAYRIQKECGPIANDRELRNDCIRSFEVYEPVRPRHRRGRYGQRLRGDQVSLICYTLVRSTRSSWRNKPAEITRAFKPIR